MKRFSKAVSYLINGWNILNFKLVGQDLITNKVDVNLNVLGASMSDRISSNCRGTEIVTPNDRSTRKNNEKFTKKSLNPSQITCSMSKSTVFGFRA